VQKRRVALKGIGFVLLMGALAIPGTVAAQDKGHLDPYVNGPENEAKLIKDVRRALVTLPYYGVFDDLGFTVNGGMVTLVGQVVKPVLKDDAGRAVKRVEGVTGVTNNIEVLPLSPNDDRIRRAVYNAIYRDPSLGTRYGYQALPSIHIIVKNGNVRLEGVVANEMDRNIAGIRTNAVSGVFKVENALKIEGK
jgi:hyperosmotically inducible periplasmic protein